MKNVDDRIRDRLMYRLWAGEIRIINSQYAFYLGRRKPQMPWFVAEVAIKEDDKKNISDRIDESIGNRAKTLVSLSYTDLAVLVSQPTFQIVDAKPISFNNKECVEIVFNNEHKVSTKDEIFIPEQRGKFILDPNRRWTLCSAEVVSRYYSAGEEPEDFPECTETISTVTRDGKSGYPIIVQYTYKNSKSKATFTYDYELDEVERLPPDEEFTLSAFGLPEPLGVQRPTRWWLWTSIVGVLLIILGAVCFRLSQRRRHA
jgi:hypothetical protein